MIPTYAILSHRWEKKKVFYKQIMHCHGEKFICNKFAFKRDREWAQRKIDYRRTKMMIAQKYSTLWSSSSCLKKTIDWRFFSKSLTFSLTHQYFAHPAIHVWGECHNFVEFDLHLVRTLFLFAHPPTLFRTAYSLTPRSNPAFARPTPQS